MGVYGRLGGGTIGSNGIIRRDYDFCESCSDYGITSNRNIFLYIYIIHKNE